MHDVLWKAEHRTTCTNYTETTTVIRRQKGIKFWLGELNTGTNFSPVSLTDFLWNTNFYTNTTSEDVTACLEQNLYTDFILG